MTAGWTVFLMLLGLWPGSANPPERTAGIHSGPMNMPAEQFEQNQRQVLALERSL